MGSKKLTYNKKMTPIEKNSQMNPIENEVLDVNDIKNPFIYNYEIDRICDVLEGKIYKRILFSIDPNVLRGIMCEELVPQLIDKRWCLRGGELYKLKELVPQLIDKRWYYITDLKLYSPEEVNTYTLNKYNHHHFSSFIHHHEDSKTWIARHWIFEK